VGVFRALAGVVVGETTALGPVVVLIALAQDTLPTRSRRQEKRKSSRCHREEHTMVSGPFCLFCQDFESASRHSFYYGYLLAEIL
jgi:hypothetical protein